MHAILMVGDIMICSVVSCYLVSLVVRAVLGLQHGPHQPSLQVLHTLIRQLHVVSKSDHAVLLYDRQRLCPHLQ